MEGTILYCTLALPLAHEYSDIYLQLCMWCDYHVFLIATFVITRFTTLWNYHLIDWLIDDAMFVCLIDELIQGFCYLDFDIWNRWIWTRIDYHPCITNLKSQNEKPKDQSFTLGPPFYKKMVAFHGIFDETLVDYI